MSTKVHGEYYSYKYFSQIPLLVLLRYILYKFYG